MCPGDSGNIPVVPLETTCVLTFCFVYVDNIVQMSLGHPVTLVWISHPVLLAWWQVNVGDSIGCFDYTGTPINV